MWLLFPPEHTASVFPLQVIQGNKKKKTRNKTVFWWEPAQPEAEGRKCWRLSACRGREVQRQAELSRHWEEDEWPQFTLLLSDDAASVSRTDWRSFTNCYVTLDGDGGTLLGCSGRYNNGGRDSEKCGEADDSLLTVLAPAGHSYPHYLLFDLLFISASECISPHQIWSWWRNSLNLVPRCLEELSFSTSFKKNN